MANTRNSAPADAKRRGASDATPRARREVAVEPVLAAVSSALAAYAAHGARIAVALSGGLDSMVLLDALARAVADAPAARDPRLSAIHVDHGISAHSKDWAHFCADQCAARGVALATHRLALPHGQRANLEAVARRERYARLREAKADVIALAHHADDQAETVLLQLLRGAGPRGLAAMPRFQAGAPALLRPLLLLRRVELEAYAQSHNVAWIEDESNRDRHHRRNLLRHDIAPRLAAAFPGYPETLQRAAEHQADAGELLDVLAAHDGAGALDDAGLDRARLAALPAPRARNLLRWFLRSQGLRAPSQARLTEMLRQLVAARGDARTSIVHDGVEIGIYRGRVLVHAPPPAAFARAWHGEAELDLPGGALRFCAAIGDGFSAATTARGPLTLRSRAGGERVQLAADRPRRALKKLLQDAGIPRWQREALPLLWCGDALVAIPGIGVSVDFQASAGEQGWTLEWRPDAVHGTVNSD